MLCLYFSIFAKIQKNLFFSKTILIIFILKGLNMDNGIKFEYEIAKRIYLYDLDNINKEIEFLDIFSKYTDNVNRLNELYILKDKKEKQLNDLENKYQK